MMIMKKNIRTCCILVLLLICGMIILNKAVIFRISFVDDNCLLDIPEALPTLYQGAIDNPKNCSCYMDITNNNFTIIDCNLLKNRNETWDYLLCPAMYVDGRPIEYRLDFQCQRKKIFQFWNANVKIHFYYDNNGELCSDVECNDSSSIELNKYDGCFVCIIKQ